MIATAIVAVCLGLALAVARLWESVGSPTFVSVEIETTFYSIDVSYVPFGWLLGTVAALILGLVTIAGVCLLCRKQRARRPENAR
jgi:hypothetical protein